MYRLLSFVAVVVVFFIQFIMYRLLSFVAVVVVFFIQFIMYKLLSFVGCCCCIHYSVYYV